MSKDLISREETMDVIKSLQITLGGENIFRPEAKASVLECLDFVPKVDAEPVRHGRWIENGPDWVCSYCGMEFKDEIEFIKLDYDYCMPHYCPHCGAKMDGGTENADN